MSLPTAIIKGGRGVAKMLGATGMGAGVGSGLAATGYGLAGARFLKGEAVDPIVDQVSGAADMRAVAEVSDQMKDAAMSDLERMRGDRIQRAVMENTARLAAADPQFYNELLAGRKLPRGARVVGGQPRTDIVEALALQMTQGRFNRNSALNDFLR